MARFSLVFAAAGVLLLVAMAAVAEASTIFTTTTFEENPSRTRGTDCHQRIMEQEILSHCRMFLMKYKGGKSQGSPRTANPAQEHQQLCCMQLTNLGEECMCEGLKMMMNQPIWSQQGMGQMGQIMDMAQNLPTQCGLTSQPCQMRAVWF